jgi:hypothetical protein
VINASFFDLTDDRQMANEAEIAVCNLNADALFFLAQPYLLVFPLNG